MSEVPITEWIPDDPHSSVKYLPLGTFMSYIIQRSLISWEGEIDIIVLTKPSSLFMVNTWPLEGEI